MSIVMTGGGTGGHLAIIKAVKEHLLDEDLIYIGSTSGQDQAWFENDEDFKSKYFLQTRGVVNQGKFGKLKSLYMLFIATLKAIKILKQNKPKVVFSVGGFSAAATSFAAKVLRIPLVIHEQNAAIGRLNKLLQPYAKLFISSYLDNSPIKEYPVKEIFFKQARVRDNIKTIIFLGGSQGAKAINELALELAPILTKKGIKIIHQAGQKNIEQIKLEYKKLNIDADVFGFTTKLSDYMSESDFAIARSGASTLWELSATALPTLFIPYPYAAGDHQFYNAEFLVNKDLAWLMHEEDIDIDKILNILDTSMTAKSQGLINLIDSNGSTDIAKLLKSF